MNYSQVYLEAISHCDPDHFLTSEQIENDLSEMYHRLKLPFGRIEMQTGIQSRGVYDNKMPSDIATQAALNLFETSEIKKEEVDLLIFASVCRDFLEPSTASVVHSQLGLRSDCLSFDLSNACLGMLSAIEIAAHGIESGAYRKVLIVTGENATPLIHNTIETLRNDPSFTRKTIKKYFANFTIGSAGVAMIIGNSENSLAQIKKSQSLSDTSAHKLCQGSGDMNALVMETESEELKERGVALARENWLKFNQENIEWNKFICHQVGIHHREYLYHSLELDQQKDLSSFERYGNTGSAALPITLSLASQNAQFQSGDNIALLGIGSGLHTSMMRLIWN
ncbi:MAG: 3-oxoacyl-ACP synthase III [Halobacteriovoraceae bacterium]|nr:3-oxoacyl-ACP synthase III [Halobacteriovoraceae bacterium]|tara:strand:- start:14839 stop:15852 length:1014 start_codon:yes stop_codon:yes gene_type:complete